MYGGIREYIHRIGRTARIGYQGLATSFYDDRNEDLAQDLVNVLKECECEIPEFLQHLAPEDGKLLWEGDDTDSEDEDAAAEGSGGESGEATAGGADAGAWSAAPDAGAADMGFTVDESTSGAPAATYSR